jgi:putative RNA 2'-phosphotransferase
MQKRHIRLSRFLSYVLRHDPGSIGLTLDAEGWADVPELIRAARANGRRLEEGDLWSIVRSCPKKRFSLSPDGQQVRANYGHSVKIELGLQPAIPPGVLYHGTSSRSLHSIREKGLQPRGRQYVHLSPDWKTAKAVGSRHGRPVVLRVEAGRIHEDGLCFYYSPGGTWLTARVPVGYIAFPTPF